MGWRFRQSFKVIPGVRLNLSRSGLSASIGAAPFTVNIGPRGLSGTASIPGTGISYRQHLGRDRHTDDARVRSRRDPGNFSGSSVPAVPVPGSDYRLPHGTSEAPIEQVRSASTELLTSDSLRELKQLMQMTFEERQAIGRELASAKPQQERAQRRYRSWDAGFLFKRLFTTAFTRRQEECETATARVAELEEQLHLTTVVTEFEIDREQADPYFRMRDAFASLCECASIWDVMTHQATDKFHERTTADVRVTRQQVRFTLDRSDLIQWEQPVPRLHNANGGDMYLYPGFILYRAAKTAFSVIGYHDVKPQISKVSFQEVERVPNDARVVGQTWAKANKDGSRDRRFTNNYQIPVVLYGALSLKSTTGLWEEFQFSNPDRLVRFLAALKGFVESFRGSTGPSIRADGHT